MPALEAPPIEQLDNLMDAPDGADVDAEGPPPEGDSQDPICFHPESKLTTDARKEDTAHVCIERFRQYRDCPARRRIEKTVTYCYKAYMGFKPEGADDVWSIRSIFRIMELLKSISSRRFFGADRLFTVKSCVEGGEDYAEGATAIMHSQIRRSESLTQLQMWHDNVWMYGTSCLTDSWQKFKQTRGKMDNPAADREEEPIDRESYEVPSNMPRFQYIPLCDFFSHPSIENPRESPAFFRNFTVSLDDIKTLMREGWADRQACEKFLRENNGGYRDEEHRTILQNVWGDDIDHSVQREGPVYELNICQTVNGWEYATLNNTCLVRAMPLPQGKIPIYCLKNYPQQQEFYGIPEPVLMLEDQRLCNEITRLWYLTNYYSAPMWKIKHGTQELWEGSVFEPGGFVPCAQMSDVEPMQCSKSAFDYQGSIEYIISKMEGTPGATKELAGAGSDQKTASGVSMLLNQAQARQGRKIEIWTPEFENAYRAYYDQDAMNLDDDQEISVRIAGADGADAFKRYKGKVFSEPNVDVDIEIGTDADPAAVTQIQNSLKTLGPEDNMQEWKKELIKAHGFKHPRRFQARAIDQTKNALDKIHQLEVTGVIPDPLPGDDPQMWVQLLAMWMATPVFGTLNPLTQQRAKGIYQYYMQSVMAMQEANAQRQMAATGVPTAGASPVQQTANADAQNRFDMAGAGAAQQGEAIP